MTAKTEPAEPFVKPAPKHLAMLAQAMRGWDYEEIRAALIAASNAGWSAERIYRETFRLLLLEDGEPAALRHAAANPLRLAPDGPGPETYDQGAAQARERLLHRHDDGDAA